MANLKIVEKSELNTRQMKYLNERLNAEEHINDAGPPSVWNVYENGLYAFLDSEDIPVGIAEASGRPVCSPGWWIDKKYRGKGLGYKLVDALVKYLVNDGVTSISEISIQGHSQAQSIKLVVRLRHKFQELTSLSKGRS